MVGESTSVFIQVNMLVATRNGTEAAKDRKCVSFPNLEPYTPLVLTSVFPSFSVTCPCTIPGKMNIKFLTFIDQNTICLVDDTYCCIFNISIL